MIVYGSTMFLALALAACLTSLALSIRRKRIDRASAIWWAVAAMLILLAWLAHRNGMVGQIAIPQ